VLWVSSRQASGSSSSSHPGISRAAEQESDPEQKRRLVMVARGLGGTAKAIAVNVASEILEHHLPH